MMSLAKTGRVMDTPIYLRMVIPVGRDKLKNRWYVIEETGEGSAADELGEEHWVHKSPKDRVKILDLPDYDHMIQSAGFAVANSRLFLLGGSYSWSPTPAEERVRPSGIVYIDLQQSDPSWCEIQLPDEIEFTFMRVLGAVVSDDGEWISAVGEGGGGMLSFRPRDVGSSLAVEPCMILRRHSSLLLAHTETKIFMYCRDFHPRALPSGVLLCNELKFNFWGMLDKLPWCSRSTTAVVVRDSYLISFAVWSPGTDEYRPALYVYDLGSLKWLPEPVQGLPNDGNIFPSWEAVETDGPISESFLMRVQRDELKFAAVWSEDHVTDDRLQTETLVHCSKFILVMSQGQYPTFRAELVSSATFNAGCCASMEGTTGR
ncbi:PREDICTED: uncharacterized protein LOC101300564 [Fragaria vesca subsp. vesca]|uniref:uncharacterized protein LOC101300564 n=1 Tax=Fragaria vesca subsp. vesca TaxID=101020 RepID=UPI0002C2EB11|nr:PREDICTED: uncharacterized protein LOC101300564 [Fragaria vesca subsp. vesca]